MQRSVLLLLASCLAISASAASVQLNSQGKWVMDRSGQAMANPQPSGLIFRDDELLFIADRSADIEQQQKIHRLAPDTGALIYPAYAIRVDASLQQSCFFEYVSNMPDYEALVMDTDDSSVFYMVTEDMSYSPLTSDCAAKWQPTGSAPDPFLLLRGELRDDEFVITHIRPIQFPASMDIGEFANDGIEGLAMGTARTLYLALEKDTHNNPRIMSLSLTEGFWDDNGFATVTEPRLRFPQPGDGQHPLNALQYIPIDNHPGYLAAFARNVDELWMIDLAGHAEAQVIPMSFWAPTASELCPAYERMDNASIEGLAWDGSKLYLINDPWKVNYKKNIQCESNRNAYERYAPLLFGVNLQRDWFIQQ